MKWSSSAAAGSDFAQIVESATQQVRLGLQDEPPDALFAFVSPHFMRKYPELPQLLRQFIPTDLVIGCSAGGVIGGGREIEQRPAVSITAARLPDVKVSYLYTDMEDIPDEDAPPSAWKEWLNVPDNEPRHFVVLADPFSVAVEPLLIGLDYAYPDCHKIGGIASGATQPGENALFVNDQVYHKGVVVLSFSGNINLDTVVAQGCRPIGIPRRITRCDQNLLLGVEGQSPMNYLESLLPTLSEYDRELLKTSLFLGLEMDPLKGDPGEGDFLMRNIIGADFENGALAIGAMLYEGMMIQFHLRDRVTSAQDLQRMLARYVQRKGSADASGALLFSCLGRGQYLYGEADHDTRMFRNAVGEVPLGGFFCNGEIGPVGSSTYVHGYTSSFGIFTPADAT